MKVFLWMEENTSDKATRVTKLNANPCLLKTLKESDGKFVFFYLVLFSSVSFNFFGYFCR